MKVGPDLNVWSHRTTELVAVIIAVFFIVGVAIGFLVIGATCGMLVAVSCVGLDMTEPPARCCWLGVLGRRLRVRVLPATPQGRVELDRLVHDQAKDLDGSLGIVPTRTFVRLLH